MNISDYCLLDNQCDNMVCSRIFCNYDNYFDDQLSGKLNDIEVYNQRGRGIYSPFIRRYGVPVLKYLMKKGLYAGKDILTDISSGEKVSKSLKRNFRKRACETFKDLGNKIGQSGAGLRKKPRINKKKKKVNRKISLKSKSKRVKRKPKSKKKTKKFDIFK